MYININNQRISINKILYTVIGAVLFFIGMAFIKP